MLTIRNFFILVSFGIFLMSSKCKQTKLIYQDSTPFKIVKSYVQKQVPGDRSRKPYYEIGIDVNGLNNSIVLDSVFYTSGKSINIKKNGFKRIKLPSTDSKEEKEVSSVIIYYTDNGSRYYSIIEHIDVKEPIYLP